MSPKRVVMEEFEIQEISGVTRPMNEHALAPIIKAASDVKKERGTVAFEKRVAVSLTDDVDGHQHGIYCDSWDGPGSVEVWIDHATSAGGEYSHSHPLMRDADGNWTVGSSEGHSHTLDGDAINAACVAAGAPIVKQEATMPEANTPQTAGAETEVTLSDLATLIRTGKEEQDARLAKLEKVASLTVNERAVFDGLNEVDKATFLGGTSDQRALAIVDAQKAALSQTEDSIVLYSDMDGRNYTRKDSPELLQMAKSRDAGRRQIDEILAATSQQSLEKRAETELSYFAGPTAAKAQLLGLLETVTDETQKSALHALLAQHNEMLKVSQQVLGTKAISDLGNGSLGVSGAFEEMKKSAAIESGVMASEDFELRKLTNDYMNDEKLPQSDYAKAYRVVCATPRGMDLLQSRYNSMPVLPA